MVYGTQIYGGIAARYQRSANHYVAVGAADHVACESYVTSANVAIAAASRACWALIARRTCAACTRWTLRSSWTGGAAAADQRVAAIGKIDGTARWQRNVAIVVKLPLIGFIVGEHINTSVVHVDFATIWTIVIAAPDVYHTTRTRSVYDDVGIVIAAADSVGITVSTKCYITCVHSNIADAPCYDANGIAADGRIVQSDAESIASAIAADRQQYTVVIHIYVTDRIGGIEYSLPISGYDITAHKAARTAASAALDSNAARCCVVADAQYVIVAYK